MKKEKMGMKRIRKLTKKRKSKTDAKFWVEGSAENIWGYKLGD